MDILVLFSVRYLFFPFFSYSNEVECNNLSEILFPETLIVDGLGVHGRLISHDAGHNCGSCGGSRLGKLVHNRTVRLQKRTNFFLKRILCFESLLILDPNTRLSYAAVQYYKQKTLEIWLA